MKMQYSTNERGNAVVEMALLGTLIFGVLIQVIVLFGTLDKATLATSAASREVGREVSLSDSTEEANVRAAETVAQVEHNHELRPGSLTPEVQGTIGRDARIRITVHTEVPALQLPFIGSVWPSLSIPVESSHIVRIDRYRSFAS